MHTYARTHTNTHIHKQTHTHIHTNTHTHTQTHTLDTNKALFKFTVSYIYYISNSYNASMRFVSDL